MTITQIKMTNYYIYGRKLDAYHNIKNVNILSTKTNKPQELYVPEKVLLRHRDANAFALPLDTRYH